MKLLNNRVFSFVVITLIYAFTITYGVVSYLCLTLDVWLSLLIADVIATVVIFLFSALFGNASVYDPYWSVQPIVIVIAFAVKAPALNIAQILPIIAVCLWGIRLTANWAYTFRSLKHQDWRYTMLNQKTKTLYPIVNFLGIHLIPTLIVYGCTLPVVFTIIYAPAFNAGSAVFFAVSILAIVLQGTADFQMHKFRKSGTSGFIRTGLWKYARHPNYLGEILMWWGIALAAVCIMPQRWYLIAGAAANTLLFVFVSVPLADKRQSRKEGFAEYKKATRMFLPIKK